MSRILIFMLLLFQMPVASCHGEIPGLFRQKPFTAAVFAKAVNHFVAIGEDAAVEELMALAAKREVIDPNEGSINIHERIGWVCRVLFVPKGQEPLRPPRYGGLPLPDESMPPQRWPLFPVALSGTTFFVLGEVIAVGGFPEPAQHYMTYCREKGIFRKTPVKVPTREQAMKDAAALRQSEAWKAIKWRGSSAKENERGRDFWMWRFIQPQAASVPSR